MNIRRVICALIGHKPRHKMSCVICDRCRYVLKDEHPDHALRTVGEGETQEGVTVAKLGHWHPDGIFLRAKHRDVYVWEVEFEQKRPAVHGAQYGPGEGEYGVLVGSREEGSMFFHEEEDGSEHTFLTLDLPTRYRIRRHGWWFRRRQRYWVLSVSEGKWSVYITALSI